jgi:catechol 2,3-dioxygenase-like lactoylglutathione lyase family enzyme
MFDHIGVVFRDLTTAGAFYRAVLAPIGLSQVQQVLEPGGTGRLIFSTGAPESPFFVVAAGRPSFWDEGNGPALSPAHLAFLAPSRAAVDAFHAAGLAAGARNNGDPGVRRGRYYCAFLIDPDGNNVEAGVHAEA